MSSKDKFNVEENASCLKALENDLSDHQKRIEQEISDVKQYIDKVDDMVDEIQAKLLDLKKTNQIIRKQKFSNEVLELTCLGRMKLVTTIRNMPGLETLYSCFINPHAESYELIAICRSNSRQTYVVKMNGYGKIIKAKSIQLKGGVWNHQTLKDYFMFESDCQTKFKRFDYDLNELEMKDPDIEGRRISFTANHKCIFTQAYDTRRFYVYSHDLSVKRSEFDVCFDKDIHRIIANDKYLYNWQGNRLRIFDIEHYDMSKDTEFPPIVHELPFEKSFKDVKLLGDEYIAIFDQTTGLLSLFTQDSKVAFVKDFEMNVGEQVLVMSSDSSDAFCFYNPQTGDIFHNLF